jgi:PEP-CTERM motif
MMRRMLCMAGTLLLVGIGRAHAAEIIFTETAIATGALGRDGFTDAPLTITAIADTANVNEIFPGVFSVNNSSTTVFVPGFGSGTITDLSYTFSAQASSSEGGIGDNTIFADILDVMNPAFATYNLTTSFGPLSGSTGINSGQPFPTTAGDFIIDSILGNTATFQATVVPEPSTLVLGLLGSLSGLGYLWRRR